jgi:hypothetical protein
MIADLIEELPQDPWRAANPFSTDMQTCHEVLFRRGSTRNEMAAALDDWLGAEQPCLFGRMEAKQHRLVYCLLTENDLEQGDDHVRARIQEDRDIWRRSARRGESHGFIIVAISRLIAHATIGPELLKLARHLCDLYLGRDELDQILLDDLLLEIQAQPAPEYRTWRVGVNYFSAQGDKRWWRDHRFPGGLAYSMNSVGHMARTRAEVMVGRNAGLAESLRDVPRERLTYWALPTAMRTIGAPAEGSTRGTWLAERGQFEEYREPPTYDQRHRAFGPDLARFSENRYLGRYHTDETIPSPYFDLSITDANGATLREDLYFTYLHSPGDRDYTTMGIGTLVQAMQEEQQARQPEGRSES